MASSAGKRHRGRIIAALALVGAARFAAAETPPPDPSAIWTLQGENASITTGSPSDRYYTNGLRLGWTSSEIGVPAWVETIGQALWGDGRQRVGFDLTQQIYTARDTDSGDPPRTDRPFAGVLLGTFTALHDSGTSLGVLNLGVGVVGPSSLAEQTQNTFHDLIDQTPTRGWNTQLPNQPLVQVAAQKTWRVPIGTVAGLETDVLPSVVAAAGLRRVYAAVGTIFRIGEGLDSDYGPARVRPGVSGTDLFRPTGEFGWYLFGGATGQAVAYDVTLNGTAFRDSRRVDIQNWVGELQVGLALIFSGFRIAYTQVFQSSEFRYQKGGLHQLGSLALSVRF